MKRLLAKAMAMAMLGCAALTAHADDPAVLRDLEGLSPHKLTAEELQTLMPGASVSRTSKTTGNNTYWVNEEGGKMFANSDNNDRGRHRPTNAPAKWNLADDRYCVHIDWRSVEAESWCRFVIKTSDGYYTTKSDTATERVYKLEIKK